MADGFQFEINVTQMFLWFVRHLLWNCGGNRIFDILINDRIICQLNI